MKFFLHVFGTKQITFTLYDFLHAKNSNSLNPLGKSHTCRQNAWSNCDFTLKKKYTFYTI